VVPRQGRQPLTSTNFIFSELAAEAEYGNRREDQNECSDANPHKINPHCCAQRKHKIQKSLMLPSTDFTIHYLQSNKTEVQCTDGLTPKFHKSQNRKPTSKANIAVIFRHILSILKNVIIFSY